MKTVSTKKTLIASVFAMLLCVSLFVGSTFAWFTDSASTSVNTIKAGSLNVELLDADGESPLGDSLKWVKADGAAAGEEVLWEPGCSYNLEGFRIKNAGNLALKYKVVINGLTGSAKLLSVIDFTVKMGGETVALEGWEGNLAANAVTEVITISGTMKVDAGNDYMNEKIENISITVVATQDTVESDSNGNTYDSGADMTPDNLDKRVFANITKVATAGTATVLENADATVVATVPADAVAEGTSLTLSVVPRSENKGNVVIESGEASQVYEINVSGLAEGNTAPVELKLYVGKNLNNLKLYHNSELMTGYIYDSERGIVTFSTTSFSPFTVVYEAPSITVDGVAYYDFASAVAAASEGSVITFCKTTTEPMKLALTQPMTIKNVKFKALSGVKIDGLQLSSDSAKTRLDLDGITFDGIYFTDMVIIGQNTSGYGCSKCTNITFDNCKFDLSSSTEKYPDAIKRMGPSVSGTISEKEAVAYMVGFTVKNCEFLNVRYGIFGGKVRNVTIENCSFADCSSYAVRFEDVAGKLDVLGNKADKTGGVLTINTVGNNYSTTDVQTYITVKDNKAVGMTCGNGNVFMTTFDNARASGKSAYTITGNSCTYAQTFDEPLNGFRIKSNYGSSVAEFIGNE